MQTKVVGLALERYQTLQSLSRALSLMYTKLLAYLHPGSFPFPTCKSRRKRMGGGVGRY